MMTTEPQEAHPQLPQASETDRPHPQEQLSQTIADASHSHPMVTHEASSGGTRPSPPPIARVVRERRLSSASSYNANEVGAPSVWATPDWAAHPVIENYYGCARRTRVNSFYEVMQSPTNTLATRTLAENCNDYGDDKDDDDDSDSPVDDETHRDGRRKIGVRALSAATVTQPTRKLGSFSYSFTTETSDELISASPSFSTSTADSGYESRRVQVAASSTAFERATDRRDSMERDRTRRAYKSTAMGYARWNRQRQQQNATTDMVPIPQPPHNLMKKPTQDAAQIIQEQQHNTAADTIENPQGGGDHHIQNLDLSPSGSDHSSENLNVKNPESRRALTSGRLKSKLQDCLVQIDDRLDVEVAMARDAYASTERSSKASAAGAAITKRESLMWSLLCGARTSTSGGRNGSTCVDGLDFVHDRLSITLHHRALNQLQRHRRHVNGILQIVTSHNPDLYLTEKQLDSFESADAMLANDIKYGLLHKQVDALATLQRKRKEALRYAKIKNGRECFESKRTKSAMLGKLLEAVSWYRLVQTNSRDESASSSVGLSVDAAATASGIVHGNTETTGGGGNGSSDHHESSLASALASGSSGSSGSSSSIRSATRSLQEMQVERILSVLAGEEFYSDYNELMCQSDWWEIAQAHFENIIFSKAESRVSQWVLRVSKDVATVCYEPLEEENNSYKLGDKKPGKASGSSKTGTRTSHHHQAAATQHPQAAAEWTKDPQPEQILEFIDRLTRRIRKELDVPSEVTKSLHAFIQRTVFPRLALLCFNQKTAIDCQRKDKLWRKRCLDLSGIPLQNLNLGQELVEKIVSQLPSRRVGPRGRKAFLIRSMDAFNCMTSVVPCDLLDELMYGVVILHHEAALVLGTTQFSVETFFPLLAYVLLHCQLPTIHAQLHLLENYAITNTNANGEESYYVYCVHAAVEYVCNSAGLSATAAGTGSGNAKEKELLEPKCEASAVV